MTNLCLTPRTAREWHAVHPMLVEVVTVALVIWQKPSCFCKSIYRSPAENRAAKAKSEIHVAGPPWRAADLSGRNLAVSTAEQWRECRLRADVLNKTFKYDYKRPTAGRGGGEIPVAYADPHGTAPHVHCQVHERTRRRT